VITGPEHVLGSKNLLGECPLWDDGRGLLCWVDIDGSQFFEWSPCTGKLTVTGFDVAVSAFGWIAGSEDLITATVNGFALWCRDARRFEWTGKPEVGRPGSRLNDGAVDRAGNFWAGTLGPGFASALYRFTTAGSIETMVTEVGAANGIAWSPAGDTMYFTDSRRRTIFAYPFDMASGRIGAPESLVQLAAEEGIPDGLTVDAEGLLWSACWGAASVRRYGADGSLDRVVPLPVRYPTSCTFGGAKLDELYITSARRPGAEDAPNGDLFRLRAGIRGMPEPRFGMGQMTSSK
jgi:sugar lactone lactonase YvrE